MNQGIFYSDDPTFLLAGLPSVQTGPHKINARTPTGSWIPSTFTVSVAGQPIEIPNIFNEQGSFMFEIENPDGTLLVDGSGCSMSVEVRLRGCAPLAFIQGGGGSGGTPYYELVTVNPPGNTFPISVNGGTLPGDTDRDLQIYQYPGGNKLLPGEMYTISGNIVTLDPMVLVPIPMKFEVFFQIV